MNDWRIFDEDYNCVEQGLSFWQAWRETLSLQYKYKEEFFCYSPTQHGLLNPNIHWIEA